MTDEELYLMAKELGAPYHLLKETARLKRLPVVRLSRLLIDRHLQSRAADRVSTCVARRRSTLRLAASPRPPTPRS